MFKVNINESARQSWLKQTLAALPAGARLLDACELKNRQCCGYLTYVLQDFCQYEGTEDLACFGGHCVAAKQN